MKLKLSFITLSLLVLNMSPANAISLQRILRTALQTDPTILEARANELAAQSSVKEARAAHYPTVALTGTQILAQQHRYDTNRKANFNPGLSANLNLYAWGGIEAGVRQNQHKADYYFHKIAETQEELGNTVGELYLNALRAKELIQAAQNNIERHKRIVGDLKIIAKHDKGRQSELDQATDRLLRAEAYLIEQTHILESNLSSLGKYTGTMLQANDLEDPFMQDTHSSLIEKYHNTDLASLPSYQAQLAEKESVAEEVNIAKAARYPRINLVGQANRDDREVYLNLEWSFYNPAAKYNVERTAHTLTAAESKMDQILRDKAERSRNAQIDMIQYLRRAQLAEQQIASQQRVVKAYELQFKIARRTLIDVLDSYGDLSNIEINAITAQNNYRRAALSYLVSQAAINKWAGNSNLANMTNTTLMNKPSILASEKIPTNHSVPTTENQQQHENFTDTINTGNTVAEESDMAIVGNKQPENSATDQASTTTSATINQQNQSESKVAERPEVENSHAQESVTSDSENQEQPQNSTITETTEAIVAPINQQTQSKNAMTEHSKVEKSSVKEAIASNSDTELPESTMQMTSLQPVSYSTEVTIDPQENIISAIMAQPTQTE